MLQILGACQWCCYIKRPFYILACLRDWSVTLIAREGSRRYINQNMFAIRIYANFHVTLLELIVASIAPTQSLQNVNYTTAEIT